MKTETVHSARIPAELHRRIKIHAATKSISVQEFIREACEKELDRDTQPEVGRS